MESRPTLTGIGSLPPFPGPVSDALRAAVDLQRAHGFGLLTDGEPRGDMLSYYGEIPGIEFHSGVPRIVGRITPPEDPAGFAKVQDLDAVRAAYPEVRFKVALTAPTTFLLACASSGAGPAYRGPLDPALHDDLTEAIRPIAHEIAQRGAFLQMDDPILSQGMRDYGPSRRRLDAIASEASRERVSLHVCGGLARSKALDALLGLRNVCTLSIAFAGRAERENLALLRRDLWQDRDIHLGAGCARTQVANAADLTSPEETAALLHEIRAKMGDDRIRYVTPDCGLRGTPPELVPPLLDRLQRGFTLAYAEAG